MMNTSKRKKITLSVAAMILLSSSNIVNANESLHKLEEQKQQLQNNVNEAKDTKKDLEVKLENIEGNIETIEKELFSLQKEIEKTNVAIEDKERVILNTKREIEELTAIIESKSADLDNKKLKLEDHLKIMHSGGKVELIEILFRSESLSQFINRYEYYKDITEKGEELYKEIEEEISFIEQQKVSLEKKKSSLEHDKVELENHKQIQGTQKKKQETLQAQLERQKHHVKEDIHEQQEAMQFLALSIATTENEIKAEKSRIEEARRKAEEARRKAAEEAQRRAEEQRQKELQSKMPNKSNNTYSPAPNPIEPSTPSQGSGVLGTPLAKGSYYISSQFGYRTHPVTGLRGSFHSGTDFAAPYGTPIYAVADGYVLFSGPAKGFGNWIVIKHDNGLYTIYGHMYSNQLYAKKGEYVFKGQHIGGVGSAGTSTGNHLHLCVATSYNGSSFTYANPLDYLR